MSGHVSDELVIERHTRSQNSELPNQPWMIVRTGLCLHVAVRKAIKSEVTQQS